jgi:Mg2+ and Co2+ transporter CorA
VSEIYSLAAASENQFLNMMERILSERIERITSTSNALPEAADLQYDRNILDAHRDQIRSTVSFLTAHDDPTWFLLSQNQPQHLEKEVTRAARQTLERDFLHLQNRVTQQILRCERAMDMITDKASLSEAQRSNSQSEGLAKLTRLTTLVTIFYVPASFVCTFFGMNFKVFGQGDLDIWIWGAVSAPLLVLSVFFLYR